MKFVGLNPAVVRFVAIAWGACYALAQPAWGHPFHSSFAEMEWNAQTSRWEVALRIDPNDLEKSLRRATDRQLVLEKTEKLDLLLRRYLADHFRVKTGDDQPATLHWLGHEMEVKAVWFYFEISLAAPSTEMEITNTLLFDTVDEQVNFVLLKDQKASRTVHFTPDRPRKHVPAH